MKQITNKTCAWLLSFAMVLTSGGVYPADLFAATQIQFDPEGNPIAVTSDFSSDETGSTIPEEVYASASGMIATPGRSCDPLCETDEVQEAVYDVQETQSKTLEEAQAAIVETNSTGGIWWNPCHYYQYDCNVTIPHRYEMEKGGELKISDYNLGATITNPVGLNEHGMEVSVGSIVYRQGDGTYFIPNQNFEGTATFNYAEVSWNQDYDDWYRILREYRENVYYYENQMTTYQNNIATYQQNLTVKEAEKAVVDADLVSTNLQIWTLTSQLNSAQNNIQTKTATINENNTLNIQSQQAIQTANTNIWNATVEKNEQENKKDEADNTIQNSNCGTDINICGDDSDDEPSCTDAEQQEHDQAVADRNAAIQEIDRLQGVIDNNTSTKNWNQLFINNRNQQNTTLQSEIQTHQSFISTNTPVLSQANTNKTQLVQAQTNLQHSIGVYQDQLSTATWNYYGARGNYNTWYQRWQRMLIDHRYIVNVRSFTQEKEAAKDVAADRILQELGIEATEEEKEDILNHPNTSVEWTGSSGSYHNYEVRLRVANIDYVLRVSQRSYNQYYTNEPTHDIRNDMTAYVQPLSNAVAQAVKRLRLAQADNRSFHVLKNIFSQPEIPNPPFGKPLIESNVPGYNGYKVNLVEFIRAIPMVASHAYQIGGNNAITIKESTYYGNGRAVHVNNYEHAASNPGPISAAISTLFDPDIAGDAYLPPQEGSVVEVAPYQVQVKDFRWDILEGGNGSGFAKVDYELSIITEDHITSFEILRDDYSETEQYIVDLVWIFDNSPVGKAISLLGDKLNLSRDEWSLIEVLEESEELIKLKIHNLEFTFAPSGLQFQPLKQDAYISMINHLMTKDVNYPTALENFVPFWGTQEVRDEGAYYSATVTNENGPDGTKITYIYHLNKNYSLRKVADVFVTTLSGRTFHIRGNDFQNINAYALAAAVNELEERKLAEWDGLSESEREAEFQKISNLYLTQNPPYATDDYFVEPAYGFGSQNFNFVLDAGLTRFDFDLQYVDRHDSQEWLVSFAEEASPEAAAIISQAKQHIIDRLGAEWFEAGSNDLANLTLNNLKRNGENSWDVQIKFWKNTFEFKNAFMSNGIAYVAVPALENAKLTALHHAKHYFHANTPYWKLILRDIQDSGNNVFHMTVREYVNEQRHKAPYPAPGINWQPSQPTVSLINLDHHYKISENNQRRVEVTGATFNYLSDLQKDGVVDDPTVFHVDYREAKIDTRRTVDGSGNTVYADVLTGRTDTFNSIYGEWKEMPAHPDAIAEMIAELIRWRPALAEKENVFHLERYQAEIGYTFDGSLNGHTEFDLISEGANGMIYGLDGWGYGSNTNLYWGTPANGYHRVPAFEHANNASGQAMLKMFDLLKLNIAQRYYRKVHPDTSPIVTIPAPIANGKIEIELYEKYSFFFNQHNLALSEDQVAYLKVLHDLNNRKPDPAWVQGVGYVEDFGGNMPFINARLISSDPIAGTNPVKFKVKVAEVNSRLINGEKVIYEYIIAKKNRFLPSELESFNIEQVSALTVVVAGEEYRVDLDGRWPVNAYAIAAAIEKAVSTHGISGRELFLKKYEASDLFYRDMWDGADIQDFEITLDSGDYEYVARVHREFTYSAEVDAPRVPIEIQTTIDQATDMLMEELAKVLTDPDTHRNNIRFRGAERIDANNWEITLSLYKNTFKFKSSLLYGGNVENPDHINTSFTRIAGAKVTAIQHYLKDYWGSWAHRIQWVEVIDSAVLSDGDNNPDNDPVRIELRESERTLDTNEDGVINNHDQLLPQIDYHYEIRGYYQNVVEVTGAKYYKNIWTVVDVDFGEYAINAFRTVDEAGNFTFGDTFGRNNWDYINDYTDIPADPEAISVALQRLVNDGKLGPVEGGHNFSLERYHGFYAPSGMGFNYGDFEFDLISTTKIYGFAVGYSDYNGGHYIKEGSRTQPHPVPAFEHDNNNEGKALLKMVDMLGLRMHERWQRDANSQPVPTMTAVRNGNYTDVTIPGGNTFRFSSNQTFPHNLRSRQMSMITVINALRNRAPEITYDRDTRTYFEDYGGDVNWNRIKILSCTNYTAPCDTPYIVRVQETLLNGEKIIYEYKVKEKPNNDPTYVHDINHIDHYMVDKLRKLTIKVGGTDYNVTIGNTWQINPYAIQSAIKDLHARFNNPDLTFERETELFLADYSASEITSGDYGFYQNFNLTLDSGEIYFNYEINRDPLVATGYKVAEGGFDPEYPQHVNDSFEVAVDVLVNELGIDPSILNKEEHMKDFTTVFSNPNNPIENRYTITIKLHHIEYTFDITKGYETSYVPWPPYVIQQEVYRANLQPRSAAIIKAVAHLQESRSYNVENIINFFNVAEDLGDGTFKILLHEGRGENRAMIHEYISDGQSARRSKITYFKEGKAITVNLQSAGVPFEVINLDTLEMAVYKLMAPRDSANPESEPYVAAGTELTLRHYNGHVQDAGTSEERYDLVGAGKILGMKYTPPFPFAGVPPRVDVVDEHADNDAGWRRINLQHLLKLRVEDRQQIQVIDDTANKVRLGLYPLGGGEFANEFQYTRDYLANGQLQAIAALNVIHGWRNSAEVDWFVPLKNLRIESIEPLNSGRYAIDIAEVTEREGAEGKIEEKIIQHTTVGYINQNDAKFKSWNGIKNFGHDIMNSAWEAIHSANFEILGDDSGEIETIEIDYGGRRSINPLALQAAVRFYLGQPRIDTDETSIYLEEFSNLGINESSLTYFGGPTFQHFDFILDTGESRITVDALRQGRLYSIETNGWSQEFSPGMEAQSTAIQYLLDELNVSSEDVDETKDNIRILDNFRFDRIINNDQRVPTYRIVLELFGNTYRINVDKNTGIPNLLIKERFAIEAMNDLLAAGVELEDIQIEMPIEGPELNRYYTVNLRANNATFNYLFNSNQPGWKNIRHVTFHYDDRDIKLNFSLSNNRDHIGISAVNDRNFILLERAVHEIADESTLPAGQGFELDMFGDYRYAHIGEDIIGLPMETYSFNIASEEKIITFNAFNRGGVTETFERSFEHANDRAGWAVFTFAEMLSENELGFAIGPQELLDDGVIALSRDSSYNTVKFYQRVAGEEHPTDADQDPALLSELMKYEFSVTKQYGNRTYNVNPHQKTRALIKPLQHMLTSRDDLTDSPTYYNDPLGPPLNFNQILVQAVHDLGGYTNRNYEVVIRENSREDRESVLMHRYAVQRDGNHALHLLGRKGVRIVQGETPIKIDYTKNTGFSYVKLDENSLEFDGTFGEQDEVNIHALDVALEAIAEAGHELAGTIELRDYSHAQPEVNPASLVMYQSFTFTLHSAGEDYQLFVERANGNYIVSMDQSVFPELELALSSSKAMLINQDGQVVEETVARADSLVKTNTLTMTEKASRSVSTEISQLSNSLKVTAESRSISNTLLLPKSMSPMATAHSLTTAFKIVDTTKITQIAEPVRLARIGTTSYTAANTVTVQSLIETPIVLAENITSVSRIAFNAPIVELFGGAQNVSEEENAISDENGETIDAVSVRYNLQATAEDSAGVTLSASAGEVFSLESPLFSFYGQTEKNDESDEDLLGATTMSLTLMDSAGERIDVYILLTQEILAYELNLETLNANFDHTQIEVMEFRVDDDVEIENKTAKFNLWLKGLAEALNAIEA